MFKNKISAVLGPTNTGKTYSAIDKLLSHDNGVIGFPLRLLARENYEFAKKKVGKEYVALITGEEKIIPKESKYFFCTVESIPDSKNFDFVAIDEVQLASDFERGHLFTEKVLNKRGKMETMFLGSSGMERILRKISPDIKILKKPRLSKLIYSGYKNLTRLPKRSAVIAFSQIEVYEIANKIKQAQGGVSVVMGVLSPDVRNAQVKLFEDGKVDHIVATDAIGLGLNLNIKYIFFSNLIKFDGIRERLLTFDEIAQIAGRAGRHKNDGYFGTTGKLKSMHSDLIDFVEQHNQTEIKKIYWRNSDLNFKSPRDLINSLSQKPEKNYLKKKNNASDHRYLKILLSDLTVQKSLTSESLLKTLWDICCIPDYSKDLDEFHSRFLRKLFFYLIRKPNKLPKVWIETQIKKIKKSTTKIAQLNHKISQVRKWSFLSFKSNWIENSISLQAKIKKIEFDLSLILHSQLTSEFIAELKNGLQKKSSYEKSNIIFLEGKKIKLGDEKIGELHGFVFNISSSFSHNNIFNKKILKKFLSKISYEVTQNFLSCNFKEFTFDIDGSIFWGKNRIATFLRGLEINKPKIKIFYDNYFLDHFSKIKEKITKYLQFILKKELNFIYEINSFKNPSQSFRAINFSILENLGHCKKDKLKSFYMTLSENEITFLKINGFKTGNLFFFFKTKSFFLKQMLTNVFFGKKISTFLSNDIYLLEAKTSEEKKKIYEKMGFYIFKINKNEYLANFEYFEKLIKKVFFFKKRADKNFIAKNELEKRMFNEPKKIISKI